MWWPWAAKVNDLQLQKVGRGERPFAKKWGARCWWVEDPNSTRFWVFHPKPRRSWTFCQLWTWGPLHTNQDVSRCVFFQICALVTKKTDLSYSHWRVINRSVKRNYLFSGPWWWLYELRSQHGESKIDSYLKYIGSSSMESCLFCQYYLLRNGKTATAASSISQTASASASHAKMPALPVLQANQEPLSPWMHWTPDQRQLQWCPVFI